ncbi:MAG: hypothetical protein JNN20_03460 [Betaproteobacteria bacterium]|nr:hypothetical protein [Betaproteobacteria bacterium]
MQRLVAILVLLLLPVQWGYAAMGNYCKHETTPAAQAHVAHHEHQHAKSTHDTGKKDTGKKDAGGYEDQDCPTCHVTFASSINAIDTGSPPDAGAPILFYDHLIPDRSPDNPYRPPHLVGA